MKKLFFIAAIIVYGVSFGQELNEKLIIEKGTFNIGGKASLNFNNSENINVSSKSDHNSFEISPNFGYTIKNNLMIGLGLGYLYSKSKNYNVDNSIEERSRSIIEGVSVFPYVKKYISLGAKLLMHVQGEFKYSEYKAKGGSSNMLNDSNDIRNTIFVGFRPGISYFFSKKLALETNFGAMGYTKFKNNYPNGGGYKSSSFSFNLDSSDLQFGLSYFF